MASAYREVTSQSWFSRIGGAFKGILVGVVLAVVAFPLLFWNEGRSVKEYKNLKEGEGAVQTASAERVDPAQEGLLVHVSGRAETDEVLRDPVFDVSANALRLMRAVEMYQWKENSNRETRTKMGGGTETVTTYTYDKEWSDRPIDSSRFKQPDEHRNPEDLPFAPTEFQAERVRLGAFRLAPRQVGRVGGDQPLAVEAGAPLPDAVAARGRVHDGGYYLGEDPAAPRIGDARVRFKVVKPTDVSLVARQVGDTFEPYGTRVGRTIDLLATGVKSAEAMFESARQANRTITWLLRLAGFLVMFIGLRMLLAPLKVLADVVPAIGRVIGAGASFIAVLVSAVLSLTTIAVAWIVYRPLLGILLLAAAIGLMALARGRLRRAAPAQPATT